MLTYKVGNVAATINQSARTASLSFPHGTDLTKVKPAITIADELAAISPASGAEVDLIKDVVYTVTAEDGSTVQYTVKATVGAAPVTEEDASPPTGADMPVWPAAMVVAGMLAVLLFKRNRKATR